MQMKRWKQFIQTITWATIGVKFMSDDESTGCKCKSASPTLNTETHIQGKPESPAREFEIEVSTTGWIEQPSDDPPGIYHVIEKSAYDLVVRESETWKLKFQRECDLNDQLRAEVESLRLRLLKYENV